MSTDISPSHTSPSADISETQARDLIQHVVNSALGPLQENLATLNSAMSDASSAVNSLQARVNQLEASLATLTLSFDRVRSETRRPMPVAVPETFDGSDRKQLENWIQQVQLYIMQRPDELASSREKCLFAAGFLRREAQEWVRPWLASTLSGSPPEEMSSLDLFFKSLRAAFGEADQVESARKSLLALRQRTTVTAYATEFRRLKPLVDWQADDATFLAIFKAGLARSFQEDLAGRIAPLDFEGFVTWACKLDEDLRAARVRFPASSNPRVQHPSAQGTKQAPQASQTNPTRSHSAKDPTAMDLDRMDRCKDCTSFELEIGLNRLVRRSPIVSFELPIVVRRARSAKRLLLAVYLPYLDSQSDFSLFFVPLFDI